MTADTPSSGHVDRLADPSPQPPRNIRLTVDHRIRAAADQRRRTDATPAVCKPSASGPSPARTIRPWCRIAGLMRSAT
jgi:hypothetical protein